MVGNFCDDRLLLRRRKYLVEGVVFVFVFMVEVGEGFGERVGVKSRILSIVWLGFLVNFGFIFKELENFWV